MMIVPMTSPASVPTPLTKGINTKLMKPEEWTNRVVQQLRSLQDALLVLYDGTEALADDGPIIGDGDQENIKSLKDEYTLPQLASVFSQCCQSLCLQLSEPSNGLVKLPVVAMINVITQCLRVSYADVKSVPSMTELADLLPVLHQAALDLMSQLVLSCKSNLLPHSRAITDLCFQTLASTSHMDKPKKSKTRACAYRTLLLVIKTFGWGRYLTRQSKLLTQELIADIKSQDDTKQMSSDATNSSKQDADRVQHRKGKKRKKNKADSYADLAVTNSPSGVNGTEKVLITVEATLGALEVSKLVLERGGFSSTETLMRCILDTAANLQSKGPLPESPFREVKCRKGLYSAVSACVTVRLEPGCSRKDSVTHFQMSNMAFNLLKDGLHLDSSHEVRQMCQQALLVSGLAGNLNRPVIRRILPDENNDARDAIELEREVQNLNDENERLKNRLLESEMETQRQSRLLATLQQEIENLKTKVNTAETTSLSVDPKVKSVEAGTSRGTPQMSSDEEEDEEEDEEDIDNADEDLQGTSTVTEEQNQDLSEKDVSEGGAKTLSEAGGDATTVCLKSSGDSTKAELDPRETSRRKRSTKVSHEDPMKRQKLEMKHSSKNNKRDKIPSSNDSGVVKEDNLDNEDGIQAMISDFVDTGPDLF